MRLGIRPSVATPVDRFRIVAFWEGISYLLLLFVAMPLKYGFGIDVAVRIVEIERPLTAPPGGFVNDGNAGPFDFFLPAFVVGRRYFKSHVQVA